MRDLVFKNLTSGDRKKKVISSCEVAYKQGIHSIVRRHFVCLIKEINVADTEHPTPHIYVLRERRSREHKEKFFCRVKGSVFAINGRKLYKILFMHSLYINLTAQPAEPVAE